MQKPALAIVLLLFLFSRCQLSYRVLLGVDTTPNWAEKNAIEAQAKKRNIPSDLSFVLDTASYTNGLKKLYQSLADSLKGVDVDSTQKHLFKTAYKDDHQPTQIRLFSKSGQELFKLVNCYIDPPIPMNWNVDDCFDAFPPKTSHAALAIHAFNIEFILSHSEGLNGEKVNRENLPNADYYAVVLWNEYFNRPSKKLIKSIQKYEQNSGERILVIYINNQNQQLWSAMSFDQKQDVYRQLEALKSSL